jgi:hypothetical protein
MKKILITLLACLAFIISGKAQHQNILISESNSCNEPSIAINPKNTNQLYAGSNINNYYYSDDGGLTWQEGILLSPEYGVWGDPMLMCDTAGSFYFFHLSNPPGGSWIDRIVCQKADTLGAEWNDGTFMGLDGIKAQDKHWATVDRSNNTIYVTWTEFDVYGSSDPGNKSNIMFSRSTDAGATWSPALRINKVSGDCIDSDNTTEGAVPCIGPDGEIYVSWAGPEGLVFDRSLDGGITWLDDDILVSDIPGGWDYDIPGIYRANGLPVTACDTSGGPNNGTIYINWTDQRNGDFDTDVWMVKSTDGGNSWTAPARVNDDPSGKQQFFTWMTIDQTNGNLYFVFYDRRNYTNNNTDVYMAMSTDGGATFVNFKISESPFIPYQSIFFGDYTNITAHDNIIRPIWTRLQDGQLSTWTALIDPEVVGIEEHGNDLVSEELSYPNPFRESSYFSFKVHKASVISLKVYDQYGRKIATLVDDQKIMPGKYIYQFNASDHDLASGIYYFSLISPEQTVQRKIILAR